jgi:hypothetical protein
VKKRTRNCIFCFSGYGTTKQVSDSPAKTSSIAGAKNKERVRVEAEKTVSVVLNKNKVVEKALEKMGEPKTGKGQEKKKMVSNCKENEHEEEIGGEKSKKGQERTKEIPVMVDSDENEDEVVEETAVVERNKTTQGKRKPSSVPEVRHDEEEEQGRGVKKSKTSESKGKPVPPLSIHENENLEFDLEDPNMGQGSEQDGEDADDEDEEEPIGEEGEGDDDDQEPDDDIATPSPADKESGDETWEPDMDGKTESQWRKWKAEKERAAADQTAFERWIKDKPATEKDDQIREKYTEMQMFLSTMKTIPADKFDEMNFGQSYLFNISYNYFIVLFLYC